MKINSKTTSIRACVLALSIGLSGCGGGFGPVEPPALLFSTAPSILSIEAQTASPYMISGGIGPFTINTSNASVANVKLVDRSFTISGVSEGSATIAVKDSAGSFFTIEVTISDRVSLPMVSMPSATTASAGDTLNFQLVGGLAPYSASVNNASVASVTSILPDASGKGGSFSATLLKSGTTIVTIKDSLGKTASLDLNVAQPLIEALELVPSAATAGIGDTLTFKIGGGVGQYQAVSNNPSIASVVSLVPNGSGSLLTMNLLKSGSTSVTILDTAGKTASLSLIVNPAATTPLPQPIALTVSPALVLIGEDSTSVVPFQITGGVGPFQVFTSNSMLSGATVTGRTVNFGLGLKGDRCISGTSPGDIVVSVVDAYGATMTSNVSIVNNGRLDQSVDAAGVVTTSVPLGC